MLDIIWFFDQGLVIDVVDSMKGSNFLLETTVVNYTDRKISH